MGQDRLGLKSQPVDLSDDLSEVVHKSSYLEVILSRYLVKHLFQQFFFGSEVALEGSGSPMYCHSKTTGPMVDMAKRDCAKVAGSLPHSHSGPKVVDLRWA